MQKAGLIELLNDDRVTLLGALLEMVAQLQAGEPEGKDAVFFKTRWK